MAFQVISLDNGRNSSGKEREKRERIHGICSDGYIRGSMGGEEETSQARTVTSPEPLPDEIKKSVNYIYWFQSV